MVKAHSPAKARTHSGPQVDLGIEPAQRKTCRNGLRSGDDRFLHLAHAGIREDGVSAPKSARAAKRRRPVSKMTGVRGFLP